MDTQKKNAKDKIIEVAWKLFLEKGYEETTLNDILKESETSRSGFYHHFHAKEDLLFRMASFFDSNYSDWLETIDADLSAADKLLAFDRYTSRLLEDSPYRIFLPQLYGYEVMSSSERFILSENRPYYQVVLSLFQEGQKDGTISSERSANDYTHTYARIQRGVVYCWLLERCSYSLADESQNMIRLFIDSLKITQ